MTSGHVVEFDLPGQIPPAWAHVGHQSSTLAAGALVGQLQGV